MSPPAPMGATWVRSSATSRQKIDVLGSSPTTCSITIRGQNEVMERSFRMLGLGLILAVILVYLLMVVLFQSYLDPFIIMFAVPGALAGILWMLTLTGTTINVESLMGAIMAVGIAVSNSILMVSFANEVRSEDESVSATDAARAGGAHAAAAGADDGSGDDPGHAADGLGHGGGR